MKKCKYRGNELNSTSEFCCNECESNYKEALEKDSRKIKYFILGIALGFLILLYGIALSNRASAIGIVPKMSAYMGTPTKVATSTEYHLSCPRIATIHASGIQL